MEPYTPTSPTGSTKSTSPWVYVGCTCGALVVLALAAFAALTWFTYRKMEDVKEGFENPAKRAERSRAVLPWESLPEGYEPLGAFSIPFLVDIAFFSTEPPAWERTAEATEPPASERTIPTPAEVTEPAELPAEATTPGTTEPVTPETTEPVGTEAPGSNEPDLKFGDRGMIYLVLRHMDKGREDLDRYLRGEGPPPDWMGKGNVNVESEEVIANGKVTAGGTELVYSARRGVVTTEGDRKDGLFNLFLATCPGDQRIRMGIWFAPDPKPAAPVAEVDWTGTPADPQALKAFGDHFRFCEGPE